MKKVISLLLTLVLVVSVFSVMITEASAYPVQSSRSSDVTYSGKPTTLQSGPANPHTPVTYYLDLNKEDYPLPTHRYANYLQSIGIFYPGDKLVIIPETDPHPGSDGCHGLPGLYFSDRNGNGEWLELKEGDKYGPLRITGSVTLGAKVVHTYVTEITVEDAPVLFKDRWAGGSSGAVAYDAEYGVHDASYWTHAIIDYVELPKYHPVEYRYKLYANYEHSEFPENTVMSYDSANPTVIWAEDLSVTYTPNEGYKVIGPEFTISHPFIEGYSFDGVGVSGDSDRNFTAEKVEEENGYLYSSKWHFYYNGAMDYSWTLDHKKYGSEEDPIIIEFNYLQGTNLTLNANGGKVHGMSVAHYDFYYRSGAGYQYSRDDFSLANHIPERDGYEFVGWYEDRACTTLVTSADPDRMENEIWNYMRGHRDDANFNIYAKWERIGGVDDGWLQEDGSWFYFKDGDALTGWQKINSKWYCFDADGKMLSGWQKLNGSWYYFGGANDGVLRTGWQKLNNKWYYFGGADSGAMRTGWQQISKKWYYFGGADDGVMKTGWQKISSKWYYFGDESDGVMKTGWKKINSKWYYFGGASDGVMKTGWQKINGNWYYFGGASDGVMKTGWQKISNKWYYFESSGIMLANTSKKIGSKTYNFNANGVCTNP